MAVPESILVATSADPEQFRLLVASVQDYAIFMLDPRGYVTTWNLGAQRIKGYAADEIIGRHFSTFYPPEDVAAGKPAMELVEAERNGRFEDEGWRVRNDGTRFWANVVITALRDGTGRLRGFGKVTRDLTARKAAEETAVRLAAERAARDVAEKANTYQRDLLAIVGHDLRNPLGAVTMSAALLAKRGDLAGWQAKTVSRVRSSAARMERIIADLLSYTRTRLGGGIPIDPREADLGELARKVVDELVAFHPNSPIHVEVEGDLTGVWDPARLEQVLSNVLSNAVDHGEPDARIDVVLRGAGHAVGVEVVNRGEMPPGMLEHVFEAFHRPPEKEARRGSGLGLGLYIAREIVRGHGGTIEVRSRDGETRLRLELPRRPRNFALEAGARHPR